MRESNEAWNAKRKSGASGGRLYRMDRSIRIDQDIDLLRNASRHRK